jgi:hypothetical protein
MENGTKKDNGREVALVSEGLDAVVADDKIVEIAQRVEKRMTALRTIIIACIKRTNPSDWVDQNGKPYLMASGAEKLRWPLGISWKFDEPVREDEEGGHYSYTIKGYFTLQDYTIEAIGTRSSRDGFFKKYDYSKGKGERVELPPSEIDRNDVKKSAITNCIGNGITRLLGIRNMTWEELKDAGLDVEKTARVEYKREPEAAGVTDSRKEIRDKVMAMADNDEKKAGDLLASFTTFVPKGQSERDRVAGKRHVKDLTEKQIGPALNTVRAEHGKWANSQDAKKKAEEKAAAPPPEPEAVEDAVSDFKVAINSATTLEELDRLVGDIVKSGIKGENYTILIRERDKRSVQIKEGKLM